jgi:hypothetical protein
MADQVWDEEAVVELFQSGQLTAHVFSAASFTGERSDFANGYVQLHRNGKIDLLTITENPQFEALDPHDFFYGQYLCCEIIPKLDVSVSAMMRFVEKLVQKGGADLASNQPNVAFRQWMSVDPSRALEVLDRAKNDDPLAINFLAFALEAGRYFDQAKYFIEKYKDKRRLSAIVAISRMPLKDSDQAHVFQLFLDAVEGGDEALFANILRAAFAVAERHNPHDDVFQSVVSAVCARPGPSVVHSCAQILWLHAKILTPELIVPLLSALETLDPSNKGTVEQVDNALRELLGTPFANDAITLLKKLLVAHSGALALSEFKGFGHKLPSQPDLFQEVLVEWLVSGQHSLCDGLSSLISGMGEYDKPIDISAERMKFEPREQIFLCRKAIGYFFAQPVFAASIVLSVLRNADDKASQIIEQLLCDPLLRNYGGKLREFLSSIGSTDNAYPAIVRALSVNDEYVEALKSVGEVKELRPSEAQRQTVHRNDSDEMRKSFKAAQRESVLMRLVSRSVVLYGKRTLTVVDGPGNDRRFMEMDLQSHSFGVEVPRSTVIDPVGLDLMLRVFRREQFRDETHSA